jgi:hypothetical protein
MVGPYNSEPLGACPAGQQQRAFCFKTYAKQSIPMSDGPDTSFGHFDNAEQIAFWNGPGGQR